MHTQVKALLKSAKRNLFLNGLISSLLMFGCVNNEKNHDQGYVKAVEGTYVLPRATIDSLINRSINLNDTMAYSTISGYYMRNVIDYQFFSTAFQMANRNNYHEAYFNMYEILVDRRSALESVQDLDEKSRNFALYCLLKSKELGYKWCDLDIEEIFLNKEVPSSRYFFRKYCEEN